MAPDAREAIAKAGPGLEFAAWLGWVAQQLDEDQRTLLSYAASSLVNRGWLSSLPKLLIAAHDTLGLSQERLDAASTALQQHGLLDVDGERIAVLAAVLSTRKTRVQYVIDDAHTVYLQGPVAALGIARGLGRGGEVRATCDGPDAAEVVLTCDETGIHSRKPESVAMFLTAWDGESSPAEAAAAGGLFHDDDALAAWQSEHDDPDGMPLTSMFFPMAATDLGDKLGLALESMLDHVANFA